MRKKNDLVSVSIYIYVCMRLLYVCIYEWLPLNKKKIGGKILYMEQRENIHSHSHSHFILYTLNRLQK